jgi:hypothetical protein
MEITAAQFSRIEPFLPVQRGNVSLSNLQVVNGDIPDFRTWKSGMSPFTHLPSAGTGPPPLAWFNN